LAVAAPIPVPAPVTMTTLSSKRFMIHSSVLLGINVGDDKAPSVFAKSKSE
jgi:hypothetical protein